MHTRQLAVLPCTHAKQEAQDVTLLALVQLFEILVSTHIGKYGSCLFISRDLKGSL